MPLPRSSLPPKPPARSPPSSVSCHSRSVNLDAMLARLRLTYVLGTSGAQAKQRLEQGFDMVSIITDVAAVTNSFQKELADVKGVAAGAGRAGY